MPSYSNGFMVIRWLDKVISVSKVVVVAIACLLVVLTATSIFLQDRVADIVLKKLNEKIVTKYSYESVKFSLLAKFPKASLELKNVVVLSSPGFDKGSFGGISGDTLLAAKSFYAEFKILGIIGGDYNIESISVENGSLTLLSDTSGNVNYEFVAKTEDEGKEEVELDLSRINLSNMKALYFNKATDIMITGKVDKGTLKTKIVGENIDFLADASMIIQSAKIDYLNIGYPFNTTVNIKLSGSEAGVILDNSTIKINKNLLSVSGLVGSDQNVDLSVKGDNLNISRIKEYLPPSVSSKLTDYNATGTLNISGTIKGEIGRTFLPKIDFSFLAQNGTVGRVGTDKTISGLFLQGSYTNGSKRATETSTLKIDEVKGAIEGYIFRGSLNLQNFATPLISVVMDGQGNIADLVNFINIKEIKSASGNLAINVKAKGEYNRERKYGITDFLEFNPTILVGADSFNINLGNDKLMLEGVDGNLTITDDIVADNVAFKYKNQSILIDGYFNNLASWLMGKEVTVTSSATLIADNLYPGTFMPNSPTDDGTVSGEKTDKKAFRFPEDMVFDLRFEVGHFLYKELLAENMSGSISYKPTLFNIKNLDAELFGGKAAANGFLIKNSDKSLMARGTFDLDKIEIQQAFKVFNNFGQSYLKSENIHGKLSGTVSALVSMDSLFTPNMKTLNVEGNYLITDGALLDFEPIKSLSKFIEVSELENIRFESLRNELLIRNNYVYIPQMEIKSSAADLSVNGKHSFDNDYEYHIKILLSEILSSKFSRSRSSNQEFGAVEDDGLGRSTLMLVIDTDGVRYDVKAVGEKIKTEIQQERLNLRQILNEEYGWYGDKADGEQQNTATSSTDNRLKVEWEENTVETGEGDSLSLPPVQNETQQEPTTPRFKIIWDDAPVEAETDNIQETTSGRRSLFR